MAASDESLVSLARAGDSAALEELLGRYKYTARSRAAMYFLYGGDRDDLIQEGMIGLYKAVCDYIPERGSFRSFAALCVNRQIMSAVKAYARQKHQPLNDSLSLDPINPSEMNLESLAETRGGDPETLLVGQETYRDIGSFLKEHLSPLEYRAIILRINGASHDEIAAALGKNKKSVDNTLRRARKKMEQVKGEMFL